MSENDKTRRPPRKFIPEPFSYHQEIELDISDINNLGNGVGRIGSWVVVVPLALAGERVRARVYANRKNYSEADLMEVLRASPERKNPECPLFGKCGGCQYQHLSYEGQLAWKRKQVSDLMKRIGGVDFPVEPTRPSPKQFGYRSNLTPHFGRPRPGENMPIGFVERGRAGGGIVDVPSCPIASDAINAALPAARKALWDRSSSLKRGGTLLLRDTPNGVCTDNNAVVEEKIGDFRYEFRAGEFFQNNPYALPELIKYAVSEAEGNRYLVDAYCGVGVFAIAASDKFEKVAGVEISENAVSHAKANLLLNKVSNCEFIAASAEKIFDGISRKFSGGETSVIIDPPRSGCSMDFLSQLAEFAPSRLVYVSCGPDTQARDVAWLVSNGYALKKLQPFDLFPQTRHVENVATLERI